MLKSKKMVSMFLAMVMVLSIGCIGVFADEITPQSVTPTTTVQLNTSASTQIIPWSVYSGMGYWKINLINNTSSMMTVRIFKDTPEGTPIFTGYVNAYSELPFYAKDDASLESGSYYVTVSTNGSVNLNGTLYYKFATSYKELF